MRAERDGRATEEHIDRRAARVLGRAVVEFDAGRIQNEPLQLGVRSVVEMAVYQIMTDYLGLPGNENCALEQTDFMDDYLNDKPKES